MLNQPKCTSLAGRQGLDNDSVLWDGRINLVGPGEDAAFQIEDFSEARFSQKVHGFGGALAAAAMRHDFPGGIEFVDAPRQFPEGEKMSLQIADLVFVRLAHIENEKIIAAIEAGLEFARSNFRHLHGGTGSFFAAHAAEFEVID